jgi:hypothetical protein
VKLELRAAKRIRTNDPRVFSCEIPEAYLDTYRSILRKNPEKVKVVISAVHPHRSTGIGSQNHHFNGHVQQIAQHTGNTFEDVKLYVKRQAFSRGLPMLMRADGSIVLSLVDGQPLPMSETDMDSQQCGWCIEECHVLAGEMGIVLEEI